MKKKHAKAGLSAGNRNPEGRVPKERRVSLPPLKVAPATLGKLRRWASLCGGMDRAIDAAVKEL
jgi:hypothetical protein